MTPTFRINPDLSVAMQAPASAGRLVVAKRAPAEATIQFYATVGESFGGISAARFADALREVEGSRAVTLYLSSEGGDFFEGIAIYSQLARFAETHDVTAIVDGIAASAGSVIAMAPPRLVMASAARLMIHSARAGAVGTAADLRRQADLIEGANQTMVGIYSKRTGLPAAQIHAFIDSGADTYFTAEQAVELGFADGIEGAEPAPRRAAAAMDSRLLVAARINAQLARDRREAASRRPVTGASPAK